MLLYRTAEPFEYPRRTRPRVLVSVSTELQEDGAIIATALEALADEPGSVVVTTAARDPSSFEPSHEGTRIVRFLPHAGVIPEVDLVVTHGGMGTT